jgi:GntR family transcriptional regulator, transcriptional repressor for pyruvate dehydrogenase complex
MEERCMLTKLSRETLAEQAARNLIAFIEAQHLTPGKLLPPESQLAANFGVSRPIIREALKCLEGKGIVEVVSGKGAVVKPLDGQSLQLFFERAVRMEREAIIDLMELRKGIEVQSAALAAQRRTPKDIARLAEIVAEMRHNLHVSDAYIELDVAFHRQIASMTRNTMLCYLVGAIRDAIKGVLHERLLRAQTDEQLERVQLGHEAILASLELGDSTAAERAMAAHFDEAVMSLVYGTIDNDTAPQVSTDDGHR